MELFAHGFGLGHGGDRLWTKILRVGAREPDAADSVDRPERAEKIRKKGAGPTAPVARPARAGQGGLQRTTLRFRLQTECEIAPVGVHVLSKQRHFARPTGGKLAYFADELREQPALFFSAHSGNDAEGAAVVAADLDRYPGRVREFRTDELSRGERVGVINYCIKHLDNRSSCSAGFVQQVLRASHVMGTE